MEPQLVDGRVSCSSIALSSVHSGGVPHPAAYDKATNSQRTLHAITVVSDRTPRPVMLPWTLGAASLRCH